MARDADIDRRLENWARWKHGAGAGGLGYARVSMAMEVVDGGEINGPRIPTSDCEAQDTDGAVMALPSELRATVEVVYVMGGGLARKARLLACTEATIRNRLGRSDVLISAWLSDLHRRRVAERERVEAVVSAARPVGEF